MPSLKSQKATAPAAMPGDGRAVNISDRIVLGAAGVGTPTTSDTLDFFIPAGARLFDLQFVGDRVDSNGTPTWAFDVGYRPVATGSALAAAPQAFAAGATSFRTAGVSRLVCNFKPIKFEEDVYITLTPTGAAATLVNGAEIHMVASINAEGVK